MKKLLALILLCALPAEAAIAFVRSGGNSRLYLPNSTVTVTMTSTAGNTIVLIGYAEGTTNDFNTPTDSAGNTYTPQVASTVSGVDIVRIWTSPISSSSATSFTLTTGANRNYLTLIAMEYSGVSSIGTTATGGSSGSVTTASVTLTTQDANNYIAAGMVPYNYTGATLTYNTGTGRESCKDAAGPCTAAAQNGSTTFIFSGDVTNASAASTSLTASWSTSGKANAAGVELRSGTASGPANSGMFDFWGAAPSRNDPLASLNLANWRPQGVYNGRVSF